MLLFANAQGNNALGQAQSEGNCVGNRYVISLVVYSHPYYSLFLSFLSIPAIVKKKQLFCYTHSISVG